MRVLLAAAPHRDTFGYSMPPPGLLRLGGELERAGIEVDLVDLAHELAAGRLAHDARLADAACERLLARGPRDVIGLSTMGATLPIALLVLERVRARVPDAWTWLGGPGTTGVDVRLLERFPAVDLVVRGEGELTVRELASTRARGADLAGVAGITWRDPRGRVRREVDRAPIEDMSSLAPYAWHLLPRIAEYKRVTGGTDGLVALDSGRGCAYDCSFCTIGRTWSRRSRTVPAKALVEDVLALREMPAAKSAYLCHDLFGANRGQAIAFCDGLIARGSPVPFEVRARADHLDPELLVRLRRAGGYRVLIGVESADAVVRETAHKGLRRGTDMLTVVDDCARAGVTPILSLILGLPGEGELELEASLDLCARAALRAGVNLSLHLVNPEPGSRFGEEFGARARPLAGIPPDMALGAGETEAEQALIASHPDLFTTFALLPGDEARLRALHAIAATLPDILMRYPRTFALLRERPAARRGALESFRDWQATGRSFESFVARTGSDLARDMLAWEQALVRAAARGQADRETDLVVVRAELVEARFDLPAVAEGLRADEVTARDRAPTWLAVVPVRSSTPIHSVQTLWITRDVADVLRSLDGTRSACELERDSPGSYAALERFRDAGLVSFAPVAPDLENTSP